MMPHSKVVSFTFAVGILAICLLHGGCGKKEPQVVSLFCSATYLPAAEELASRYYSVYGVVVRCVTIDEPPSAEQGEENATKTPSPLESWMKDSPNRDFSLYLLDHPRGDMYLCDAEEEARRLQGEGVLVSVPKKIAYLRPVLIVPESNPNGFHSLREVLRSGRPLGVVREDAGGLGRRTQEILEQLRKETPGISETESLVVFSSPLLLLQAFEKKEVEAAIVWDQMTERLGESVTTIDIGVRNLPATPLCVLTLSFSERTQASQLFGVFAASEEGRKILEKHGYRL